MPDGEAILAALISEASAPTIADATARSVNYYAANSGIDWIQRSLPLIAQHYFRDYGEAWDSVMRGDTVYLSAKDQWWMHYTSDTAMPADDADAEDFENLFSKWTVLSRNRLTTATYEEWLRTQGVVPPPRLREPDWDLKVPELIRHTRDWQYPVATIDPSTGVASSAVSWVVNERFDRARRFTEPGFIIGFAAVRPKSYLSNVAGDPGAIYQPSNASGYLRNAKAWIPPVYADEPGESLEKFTTGTGPLRYAGTVTNYWLDWRDLFLEGDQFIGTSTPSLNAVMLERRVTHWKYPKETSVSAAFSDPANPYYQAEGMISLRIAGRVRRTTTG